MSLSKPIYLDYAATTPVDIRVLEVMVPYFSEIFGNTSSIHYYGQRAEAALEQARESMAKGLHCQPAEIIFTSCGSESDNLALRGIALQAKAQRGANHLLITSNTAQSAAQQLQMHGSFNLRQSIGQVDPDDIKLRLE
jgi:cysteine desulfurase